MQSHPIKERDPFLGLEGRAVIELPEMSVDLSFGLFRDTVSEPTTTTGNSQPLRLMDGHHLNVAFGKRPVRILVLVDAAGV